MIARARSCTPITYRRRLRHRVLTVVRRAWLQLRATMEWRDDPWPSGVALVALCSLTIIFALWALH